MKGPYKKTDNVKRQTFSEFQDRDQPYLMNLLKLQRPCVVLQTFNTDYDRIFRDETVRS